MPNSTKEDIWVYKGDVPAKLMETNLNYREWATRKLHVLDIESEKTQHETFFFIAMEGKCSEGFLTPNLSSSVKSLSPFSGSL